MYEKRVDEKLDIVLSEIIQNTKREDFIVFRLTHHSEFLEILEKLARDGYIKRKEIKQRNSEPVTENTATIEGIYFYKDGGYTEKIKRDRLKSIKNLLGSRIVLFGAGSAGIYYCFELLRIYIQPIFQHACACQFVWQNNH